MTKEQEIVRSVFDSYIRDLKVISTKKDRPTFDMLEEVKNKAIKALEQQPSDDCVSRQAVEKITWEEPSYNDALNVLTEVRDKVRALPPVTPTFQKGATNGDVIKAVFPNVEFKKDHEFTVWGFINGGDIVVKYDIDWWNAPYKGVE